MTDTASSQDVNNDEHLLVEDVVNALTGGDLQRDEESVDDLRERMEGAATEFDERTAFAFGRALLDSLCEDPGNLRQLEALLILGLAHPDVLERHRISLAVEGHDRGCAGPDPTPFRSPPEKSSDRPPSKGPREPGLCTSDDSSPNSIGA